MIYKVVRFLLRCIFGSLFRLRVEGQDNIPSGGGVIVAPNHVSYADPPLIGAAAKRPVCFMAKESLFSFPPFAWLIRNLNAFPVKRGENDIDAFRKTLRLLEAGKIVTIFPEGRRGDGRKALEPRAGVGMIACLAGVPVVPVLIVNSGKMNRMKRLTVRFGKPLHYPDRQKREREDYVSFSERVMNGILVMDREGMYEKGWAENST